MKTKHTARKIMVGTAMTFLAAGAALTTQTGIASASTTVKVYSPSQHGGYGSSFSCNSERALAIAADNKDGAGYFYGPCVQAPDAALASYPVTQGKWYFTLQRH